MKKLSLMLLPILLTGCDFKQTFRYICYYPDVYDSEVVIVASDTSQTINCIKTSVGESRICYYSSLIRIESSSRESFEENLLVWNETVSNWDKYRYDSGSNSWIITTAYLSYLTDFDRAAMYCRNVDFRKSDIKNTTPEYISLTWGNGTPDDIRVSNNDYHICLYHSYNGSDVTYYHEFTRFIFDEVQTPIPHINDFPF